MFLTTTSDLIRLITGSAVDVDVRANWADFTASATTSGRTNTKITTATTTTIVGSPGASTERQVKSLVIRNIHASSSNLVTIEAYDGSTAVAIYKRTLLAGESVVFDGFKFITYNAAGLPVQVTEAGSIADGDYGDITVSGSGLTWSIENGVVTLAKIVDATGQYKIMARSTAGAGDWEELTGSSNVFSFLQADDYAAMLTLLFGVTLPENTAIQLDAALSADGKYSGIVLPSQTAGAALAFGDLCYLQTSDSRWELVDADAEATCSNLLGMCVLAAAGDGSATTMLILGKIRADSAFPTMTIGANMFASTTPGDIQTAAPSGAADIIRVIGQALTADELFFNPSQNYYEHA